MEFHPTGTRPRDGARIVCRYVRWNVAFFFLLFWAIPFGVAAAQGPRAIVWIASVFAGSLSPALIGAWRRRGAKDNWVLALDDEGAWLNLRDCEFADAAAGETVLFVPYAEIAAARPTIRRYTLPGSDGHRVDHKDVALELSLSAPATEAVRAALAADRLRPMPTRTYLFGLVTVSAGRGGAPVEALDDDRLRIMFSDATRAVTPRLKRVFSALKKHVAVEAEAAAPEKPVADSRQLDERAFDALVLELSERGRRIEAVTLLKERRGLSTTAAVKFLDELRRQLDEQAIAV